MWCLWAVIACSDPPDPEPTSSSPSFARWVEWKEDTEPVDRPVAVFVDVPGGPVDRIAADSDVTTFLNDRFHPVFHLTDPEQPVGTVAWLTADGCVLRPPETPGSPDLWIAHANEVIVLPGARGRRSPHFTRACPSASGSD